MNKILLLISFLFGVCLSTYAQDTPVKENSDIGVKVVFPGEGGGSGGSKSSQSITFPEIPVKVFGELPFDLNATASSGLTVSYSSSNTAVATVFGRTVTIHGAGSAVITASQPGNNAYNPAADVQHTLTVNKAEQTISFNSLPFFDINASSFTLNAESSSQLPLSYSSSDLAVATVSGNTVTLVGVGSTIITATQAGNDNYNPAVEVQQTLSVTDGSEFITTWKPSGGEFTIPTTGTGYNYNVYWEEIGNEANNNSVSGATGNVTISGLNDASTYRVFIVGDFPRIYFNNGTEKLKILSVEQWGSIAWTSMEYAFFGCTNLTVPATDAPDLSSVTSIADMFHGASSFNEPINHWDVSTITAMNGLFYGASSFNQPLDGWVVDNVILMSYMFYGASSFNQPLSSWNVINVTNMSYMFRGATSFNQPIGNWNTSNVTNMQRLFGFAYSFDQPLNNWNVGNVTNMTNMFYGASVFNQPLDQWDVSNVTSLPGMFYEAMHFNQSLGSWQLNSGAIMTNMLDNCGMSPLNYDNTLLGWSNQAVVGRSLGAIGLKYCAESAARDILTGVKGWTISGDLSDCSNVISFDPLPYYSVNEASFSLTATSSSGLPVAFSSSNEAIVSISGNTATIHAAGEVSISATQIGDGSFLPAEDVTHELVVQDPFITTWQPSGGNLTIPTAGSGYNYKVRVVDINDNSLFYSSNNNTGNVTVTGLDDAKTYQVEIVGDFPRINFWVSNANSASPEATKIQTVEQWGDIAWSSMFDAFAGCSNLSVPATDAPDLSNVTDISWMFFEATSFNESINHWDVSNVTIMEGVFYGATSFNQPLDSWDVSNATSISYLFYNASSFNQPLNTWNVGNVTDMSLAFLNAAAFNQPLDNWDLSSVTTIADMFNGASAFNQPLNTWNVSAVTAMNGTFLNANSFNQSLSSWNVVNVTTMNFFLNGASSFNQSLGNWTLKSDVILTNMLSNSAISPANYDSTLIGWSQQGLINRTLDATGLKYCGGASARDLLTGTNGWIINGDSPDCSNSITFDPLAAVRFGDAAFELTATATSGLSVSYASSDETVATISGSTVTIVGAGTANITASQAGDTNYAAATDAVQPLTVNKANQTVSFEALAAVRFGDAAFELTATATSGLSVSYASSDETVATISGSTVTIVGAGTANITASQAGDTNYAAATEAVQPLTVNKADQTISINPIANKLTSDAPFEAVASSSSGLPVSLSLTGPASISGNTITLEGTVGTVTLSAAQAGNANYTAANEVSVSFTVGKANQSISFSALPAVTFGDAAFDLTATASSGLAVRYSSSDEAVATVSGSTVSIVGAGTCSITATQAGDAHFSAATPLTQTLVVNKASQTLTLDPIADKFTTDGPFEVVSSSSAGLAVSLSVSGPASLSGSTLTLDGTAGTVSLTASQEGNANYLAAAEVSLSFAVDKEGQSITFTSLPALRYGDGSFDLTATSSSGLAVTYVSSDESVATITGSTLTIVGAGTASITASQAGDDQFSAATEVAQVLTVDKAGQTLTLEPISDKLTTDAPFEAVATSSAGLAVTLSVSGPASLSGTILTLDGTAGTVTVTASQAGNGNYHAAADASVSFEVRPAQQAQRITFDAIGDQLLEDGSMTLSATASSGLAITYELVEGPASISGNMVSFIDLGTVRVRATQGGNEAFFPAEPVEQSFTIITLVTGVGGELGADLSFYPNPANDHITVRGDQATMIEVVGLTGNLVLRVTDRNTLDVSSLKAGSYFIRIVTARQTLLRRFIKL